jgi:flagellar basal body-associated protein FliL
MAEDDQAAAKDDTTESDGSETGLIAKIKSDKKLMIMVGGGGLLLLLLIGGAAYYFLSDDEIKSDVATEGVASETEGAVEGDDAASGLVPSKFEKVHMYPLKPFFFPIKLKSKENSGHFLLATPSFNMSNAGLGGQISKNLPGIRKRIYNLLLSESYTNLTTKTESTKERVKKRIITKVNELLPVGTGVIQEVYFSEFLIK